ncbi:MAG: AAA family ATPase [Candidatus Thermoplasmatota archaeon]
MLISISGSQGAGKTTIINELKQRGFPVVERKTSRSILQDWNVTLEEVNTDLALAVKFQEEILKRKWYDELTYYDNKEICFTERTYIDLMVYAIITFGKHNEYAEWLDEYCSRCLARTKGSYIHNFFIKAGHFQIEKDGVRGHSKYYSKLVDTTMLSFYKENIEPYHLTVIDTPTIEDRVNIIFDKLNHNLILTHSSK